MHSAEAATGPGSNRKRFCPMSLPLATTCYCPLALASTVKLLVQAEKRGFRPLQPLPLLLVAAAFPCERPTVRFGTASGFAAWADFMKLLSLVVTPTIRASCRLTLM